MKTLSNKEVYAECKYDLTDNPLHPVEATLFHKDDVKKFIKDLKESIPKNSQQHSSWIIKTIDELSGFALQKDDEVTHGE